MSNEQAEQTEQQEQPKDGSALRKQLEEVLAENKELKSERWSRIYEEAGLPEGARDVFGKVYEGEASVEAVREYAEQAGFRLNDTQQAEGTDPAPEGQQPSMAEVQREQAQGRLDAAQSASLPPDKPSTEQQILEAQANGDWETSFALKSQLLDEQRRTRRDAGAAI